MLFIVPKCSAQAFWPFDQIFSNLKKNATQDISYHYKIVVEDLDEKLNIDSLSGVLFYSKNRFVDSNNQFLMVRNEQSFCRLEHDTKKATIANIEELKKKLKASFSKEPITFYKITEDFLQTEGNKIQYDMTNKITNRIIITPKDELLQKAIFDFNKSDNRLIAAYFEIDDIDTDINKSYRVKYSMFQFSYAINENVFNLSRIFKIIDGKINLNSKYANYNIVKII